MSLPTRERIEHDFTYHAPSLTQQPIFGRIRGEAKQFALTILECTPLSREQSIALSKLEEASMWANAAVARHREYYEPQGTFSSSSQKEEQ